MLGKNDDLKGWDLIRGETKIGSTWAPKKLDIDEEIARLTADDENSKIDHRQHQQETQ